MTLQRSKKAQDILDRLSRLEQSQHDLMQRLQSDHEQQMDDLRKRLQLAKQKCADAEQSDALVPAEPLFMQVNMTEVEAAVRAATFAEQESTMALEEAKKVAEEARRAAGTMSRAAICDAPNDTDSSLDNEYIVKKVSVNLDDVERVINNSSYVRVCRAFGLPDPRYGNEVYCAVVPRKGVKVSEPMLSIHAQKFLPTAQVPKRFYLLSDLPAGVTRQALADTQMSGGFESKPLPPAELNPLLGN